MDPRPPCLIIGHAADKRRHPPLQKEHRAAFRTIHPHPSSPRDAPNRGNKRATKESAVQGPRQAPSKFLVRKAPLRGHIKSALYPRKIPGAVVYRATSHLGGPGGTQLGESPPKAELEIVRSLYASLGSGLHKRLCSLTHLAHKRYGSLGATPYLRGLKGMPKHCI